MLTVDTKAVSGSWSTFSHDRSKRDRDVHVFLIMNLEFRDLVSNSIIFILFVEVNVSVIYQVMIIYTVLAVLVYGSLEHTLCAG
jgi:hypothetical protein